MSCNGYMDFDRFDFCRNDRCCGCYDQAVEISGNVTAVATGEGAPGIPIHAQVGCRQYNGVTDALGNYTIRVPRGKLVILTPELGLGVTVAPTNYIFYACDDRNDLNFALSVI